MADKQVRQVSEKGDVVAYVPGDLQVARIENDFSYHPPKPGQLPRYEVIRGACKNLATLLTNVCPESRELSIALTSLSEVCMQANAAIARNE